MGHWGKEYFACIMSKLRGKREVWGLDKNWGEAWVHPAGQSHRMRSVARGFQGEDVFVQRIPFGACGPSGRHGIFRLRCPPLSRGATSLKMTRAFEIASREACPPRG